MAEEHKFHLCWEFGTDYEGVSCANSKLLAIAKAFIRNMNRVRGIGTLPINLITIAIVNESARIEALANKGVLFHDARITHGDPGFDSQFFSEVMLNAGGLLINGSKTTPSFTNER